MMVIKHQGKWYMVAEGEQDQAQLLTSNDGVTWKREGTLDVRLKNGNPIPPGPIRHTHSVCRAWDLVSLL